MAQTEHEVGIGKIPLKAAGLVAESGINPLTPVVGHGAIDVVLKWTALETDYDNEIYVIKLEANTKAAPATWVEIAPPVVLGHADALAGAATSPATGTLKFGVMNTGDYQIRSRTFIDGNVVTGINYTLDIYPLEDLKI